MTRSYSNGRSSNGDDMSGSSRPGGCSYLSNVRPDSRSTLCSMMAQLTEETQPSFETTLKSKAVSENCNVKFSCVVTGHPAPQVIWYKDDVQLDRYCGLPKYEIFRNGQSHSLHIYNCTVEDAAIYQASASNVKGIVSCSGVLEVGEMNEFKIHQRYFAKLKQRAENRRREAEGKENQEPLRTISPDRTQRKRRSTMEAFLSTPSSMEEESNEESHHVVAAETESRLQEAAAEEVKEKPVPITNGAVSPVTNGQAVSESNKSGTYVYEPTQKIFTAHQPKTPFIKKKIKISNSSKVAKSDTTASEERRAEDETSTSVAVACSESGASVRSSEEVMEVENVISSPVVDLDSRNLTKQQQKSTTKEVVPVERPSKTEKGSARAEKDQLAASVQAVAPTSKNQTVAGKQTAKQEKEAARKDTEHLKKQIPHITPAKIQPSAAAAPQRQKENISKTAHVTVVDAVEKSDTSTGASPAWLPCELAGDQVSEKETRPRQKNVSVSEVTQAHTKLNRNGAPVNLERPLDEHMMDAQPPQKTPSERETSTDDIQTLSVHHGLQAAIDKMTQDTCDHSRGSNESHTALFTDLQKSPPQGPGGGENTRGCNVAPSEQQSLVDTAIKFVDETEIQVDEKVESKDAGELLVQSDSKAPNEKIVEMETESVAPHVIEPAVTETTKDAAGKEPDAIIVDASNKENERNEPKSGLIEESCSSELQNLKTNISEPVIPLQTTTAGNTNLSEFKDFQEVQKPVTKVISIAELLRAQIKALESSLANSVNTIPLHADFAPDPTKDLTETFKHDSSKSNSKAMPDRNTEMSVTDTPPKNIKETLMEIYNLLNKTEQEQSLTQDATSPPVQALQKNPPVPPISVVDTGSAIETAGLPGSTKKYNEGAMDVCQQTGATLATLKDRVSLPGTDNVKHNFPSATSKDELTNGSISDLSETISREPGSPLTVIPVKSGGHESNIPVSERVQEPVQSKDIRFRTPKPELIKGITETLSDQHRVEEKNSSLESVQKFPVKSADTQENNLHPMQQDSSMNEEFSRTNYSASKTPEASPRLKKRNCASPIPSATAQELASGARRKILMPKAKPEEASEATSPVSNQNQRKEVSPQSSMLSPSPLTVPTSPNLSRRSPLLQPPGEQTPPAEKRSPLMTRRKMVPENHTPNQQPTEEVLKTEGKPAERDKPDPFKAPQVIRKIRGETFADSSGHLKLWCQFFNVLSDSTVKWYKNEEAIAQIKRNAGDESQVNLAIVQASSKDSGVYGCTITNEYGTDSTDCLLSADILAGMSLREDLGVGEEIEMTPMIFSKGVADSGVWGNKFFGRIMMQESQIGDGCSHKVWRAKVIYGLEPVFESGNTCIIKVCNPIAYEGKGESCLIDRNLDIVKQECKIQNLAREYCKIFSAEARAIESFGTFLEVIPVYLMYRPANTVPYASVEADLTGVYQRYSVLDHAGKLHIRSGSEVEQKCCALQHWIFQWTSGNLLLSRLEGVDTKITNVGISVKSTGHQGLTIEGDPKVFEQFVSQHQCNYFCGLLSLRSLKVMDSLLTPVKPKGSRSPLLQRKMAAGSSSPQTGRKAASSPRMPRKTEQEGRMTPTKAKAADPSKTVKME